MTGAIPVYLAPARNGLGIIGPIPPSSSHRKTCWQKLAANPLSQKETNGKVRARWSMTNSTYDGLCYNVDAVVKRSSAIRRRAALRRSLVRLRALPRALRRYATRMSSAPRRAHACQHVLDPVHAQAARRVLAGLHDPPTTAKSTARSARFNEAFMMHTSTSPQYGIIASLDVAARDDGTAGRSCARAGNNRRGAQFPARHDCREEANQQFLVVRRMAARADGGAAGKRQSALGAQARRSMAWV